MKSWKRQLLFCEDFEVGDEVRIIYAGNNIFSRTYLGMKGTIIEHRSKYTGPENYFRIQMDGWPDIVHFFGKDIELL